MSAQKSVLFVFALFFFTFQPVDASLDNIADLQQEIVKISEDAKKSVAFIKTKKSVKMPHNLNPFWDLLREFGFRGKNLPRQFNPRREGLGTGFVIDDKRGYIVTNNHVIDQADSIEVIIDGKKFKAVVVGSDPKTDIGLIKVKQFKKGEIVSLEFSDSDDLKVGSFAIAIGNPFGLSHSVTFGIISAIGRSGMNVTEYEDFIQTDAAINPGNSGGPLLNIAGKVIGMNTAIFSKSGGYMGIGFAVPANMIKTIVNQLKDGKKVKRALLGVGIQNLTDDLRKHLRVKKSIKGVLITSVGDNSPAQKAGIKQGDVITVFNGKKIKTAAELKNAVAFSPINKKLRIEIIRNSKRKYLTIQLTDSFKQAKKGKQKLNEFGFSIIKKNGKLVVNNVEPGSLASVAGLMEGDIIEQLNRRRVKDVRGFLKRIRKARSILLLINRDGREFFIVINR